MHTVCLHVQAADGRVKAGGGRRYGRETQISITTFPVSQVKVIMAVADRNMSSKLVVHTCLVRFWILASNCTMLRASQNILLNAYCARTPDRCSTLGCAPMGLEDIADSAVMERHTSKTYQQRPERDNTVAKPAGRRVRISMFGWHSR